MRSPGITQALTIAIELTLELGEITDTVTVRGTPATLQTQSAETGQMIGLRQIADLPLLGRNFLDLTLLIPGVTAGAGGNNANYSVNGQREFSNSIVVNGIEVTGNRNNDTNVRPGIDSVLEFKTVTSAYAPEFGRASGGVIAIQTKSGSNEFHGSLFEFLRTNKTTARIFFSAEPSGLKENDFGVALGGPVRRNRTFFFASYEGKRQRNTYSYLDTTVPAGTMQLLPTGAVDLSRMRDPYTGRTIPIFDPGFYNQNYASQQFVGNIIPASRVSRAGLSILQKLFPPPNTSGILNGWFNNYRVAQRYSFNSDTGGLRFEHAFTDRDRISVTYDVLNFRNLTGDRFAGAIPIAGGGSADSADRSASSNHALGASYTELVNAAQINELRFSFLRTPLKQNHLIQGNLASQFGIGNVNLAGFPASAGLPQIYLGFGALTGGSTYKPLTFEDNNFSLADNYSWDHDDHIFKFGYEFRHLISNPNFSLFPTGFQYYYGAYASLTSDPTYSYFDQKAYYGNGGNEIADLLLGIPGYVAQGLQLTTPRTTSFENHAFWQDAWRVSPRLTLNYGVRYEYQAPYREVHNHQANFDPGTRGILLAGAGANSRALVTPDKSNFAPRFGLAWEFTPKSVLRTGYGIFFTPENSARSDLLTKNYPFFFQQTFSNSPGSPFTYLLDAGVPRPASIPIPVGASTIDLTAIHWASAQSIYYVDPNFRTGHTQMFNFILQREITPELTIEAGYVGALSHKLAFEVGDLNLAKRISKQIGLIQALFSEGNASYHSLQLKAERRLHDTYSFLISYTLAKALDNGPAPFDLGRNHQVPQNALNLSIERGPSSTDARHNLVANHIWELPFGKGKRFLSRCRGFCQAAVEGWQFNGITVFRSGLPANVVRNGNLIGYAGLRPNALHDPNLDRSRRTLSRYFDVTAFSVSGLGKTQPGDAGRNIIRGPAYINLDASLFKDIRLPEKLTLQIRAEVFNAGMPVRP